MSNSTYTTEGINHLLDLTIQHSRLKNDAALSRALDVGAPAISKLRHGSLSLGGSIIIRIHELTNMPIREIKSLAVGSGLV